MFEKIYSVSLEPGGTPIAHFVTYASAWSVANAIKPEGSLSLVSEAPIFVSFKEIKDQNEADEESERQAFAEMLKAFHGDNDELGE